MSLFVAVPKEMLDRSGTVQDYPSQGAVRQVRITRRL